MVVAGMKAFIGSLAAGIAASGIGVVSNGAQASFRS
jgi:hypothetical protein